MGDAQHIAPVVVWLRRDLRLADHPALTAAVARPRPVIAVFIRDASVDTLGAAARWRLGQALKHFAGVLAARGSRLILRSGDARAVLPDLVAQTGAKAVYWTRAYDAPAIARDTDVKARLKADGIEARSFPGAVLFEPWTVTTGAGGPYRVFTPFWRAVRGRDVPRPDPAPAVLPAPAQWPDSEDIADWRLGAAMRRGAKVVVRHAGIGERVAQERLDSFVATRLARYQQDRDFPAVAATSGLSENLAWGEIGPATIWQEGLRALEQGVAGAEHFLRELAWRDFAWHLMYHSPEIATRNWRPDWDGFDWNEDPDRPEVIAWKQGRTGVEFVDAAMREMYVTGRMHNRARMIVASYLTKHLLTHWRIGQGWFADCLTDWDPASNAMGWQWVAGSGPDAAPYFRVFNPETQAARFDPDRAYRDRWLAEGRRAPDPLACSYYEAIPRCWGLSPQDPPAQPALTLAQGRERALAAYAARAGGG